MKLDWNVIIIGGGIAGVSAAKAIREAAFDGSVLLMNGEDRAPYKRTKLSKHLASGFHRDAFRLQPPEWYHALRIDLLDAQAAQIDPAANTLTLASGDRLHWGKLILATGATPSYPPHISPETPHLHVVRQTGDAERLTREINRPNAQHALVVGMGVLGVEVAEQFRLAGKQVTLVGRSAALMPRQLNAHAAALMTQACEEAGIHLRFDDDVADVMPCDGERLRVTLRSGVQTVDVLVCCTGAAPNATLARQAGLAVNVGILTNAHLQTSCPEIFAAGDVAELPGGEIGGLWHSAEAQGMHAGKNAVAPLTPYPRLPFRLKCEVFGQYVFSMLPQDAESCHATEYRHDRQYQCFYYRDERLCGVIMVNDGDRAKHYERAAREGWTRQRVKETLAFGLSSI